MKENPRSSATSLHTSLHWLRYSLPVAALLFVIVHQSITHAWLRDPDWSPHVFWQVLPYATIGPIVIWLALTWFARWAGERDEAETHLRCLNEISRRAATATDMEALVDIALRMPEEVISPAATSLIVREHPDGPWTLAGAYGLERQEEAMLAARLTASGSDLYCGQCAAFSATARQNCTLQIPLPQADMAPTITSVICLPLSTERPPVALLNIHLLDEGALSPGMRRVLESMAAVLSVALDHARLRTREYQMLHRMEQASRQPVGLTATLTHILEDIVTVYRAQTAQVFVTSMDEKGRMLTPFAAWPGDQAHHRLVSTAQRALLEEDSVTTTGSQHKEYMVAIPLMAEGLTMGVLTLASQHRFSPSQQAFLQVAAGMIALMIRNSQLYARLESQAVLEERNRLAREVHDGLAQGLGFLNFKMQQVERLLARDQGEAARQALGEMQDSVQDLYAEVRRTIQDLRWLPEDGRGLSERLRQYVLDLGDKADVDISLDVADDLSLSPQEELHLFRIVQEALTNVHKHAQARHAWVRLRAEADATVLEIEDDGAGFSAEALPQNVISSGDSGHFGLRIMQERAEAMGGGLSVHSTPGQGTRLQVRLNAPLPIDPYSVSASSRGR